ncbi:MAG: hypothetical protein K2H60_01610 [Muribaculaceae bacterium]|nr:hypothetical protein [Muribaculaceae bacterium]
MSKFEKCLISCLPLMALVACNNNDEPKTPVICPTLPTDVVYILNQGNSYSGIDGSLNVIDLENLKSANSVFKTVNGRTLGSTPQCGVVYGSKIYVGASESQTIEVIDRNTYESIQQISLQNSSTGKSPRSMVATGGKVYISLYEGYVACLDTLKCEIEATTKVGANPDIMCLHQGKLYVPNSEGMNYLENKPYGTTASVVTLNPFIEEKVITVPLNPTKFMSDGSNLFLLCMGDYFMESSAVYKISDESAEKIADATVATAGNQTLLIGNNPYVAEGSNLTYTLVDTRTGVKTPVTFADAPAPSNVGIDPKTGNIIITTYEKPAGMFADYDAPGWTCAYGADLNLIKKFKTGSGPAAIFFNE